MKKNLIRLFFVIGVAAMFYSCGGSKSKGKIMQTETRKFEQKYYLTEDKSRGVLTVNMQVELPVEFHNSSVLQIVRDNIVANVFGHEYVQFSNKELLPRFASDMNEEYRDNNLSFFQREMPEELGYAFNNDFLLETFVLLSNKHVFSYGVDLYVYMGGAHGLNNRTFLNYNLKDGSLILEDDLFNENFEPVLTELMKRLMMADLEISEEELEETYWVENIVPNGNFYISYEAINYVFNPYEIAPYVFGHTEISIPFEEIKEILKPNSPIRYLMK
jgi:hypothetical protein